MEEQNLVKEWVRIKIRRVLEFHGPAKESSNGVKFGRRRQLTSRTCNLRRNPAWRFPRRVVTNLSTKFSTATELLRKKPPLDLKLHRKNKEINIGMVSYLGALFYVLVAVVTAGLSLLVAFQERLVYVPVLPGLSRSYAITPARLRLAYEDVWLRSADGVRLHAWFIKIFPNCPGPTILFFQENAGNIAHRLEFVRIMLQKLQCNVFLLSYRGYGASDGDPSQHGIIMDAQAALDHLSQRNDIDTSKIVVFGRSLGGAVGSILAKNNPDTVSALILENTFTSILDMAGVLLPILKWFIGGSASKGPKILNFFVRSPWSTIDIIGQVKQPILFLSGLQDEMVPPFHMQMLYSKAVDHNSQCLLVDFPSGMHMDTWLSGGDRYWRTIQLFLDQYVPQVKESERKQLERPSS